MPASDHAPAMQAGRGAGTCRRHDGRQQALIARFAGWVSTMYETQAVQGAKQAGHLLIGMTGNEAACRTSASPAQRRRTTQQAAAVLQGIKAAAILNR